MESGTGQRGQKRKLVAADGVSELPDAKRANTTMDKDEKSLCIIFLLTIYNAILSDVAVTKEDYTFINLGCNILSIIYTCHKMLRQKHNGQSTFYNKYESFQGKCKTFNNTTKTVAYKNVCKLMETAAEELGLKYQSAIGKKSHWYGTFAPLLTFFSVFMPRVKELRVGHSEMQRGKTTDGSAKSTPISMFGVSTVHHVQCEGISYSLHLSSLLWRNPLALQLPG